MLLKLTTILCLLQLCTVFINGNRIDDEPDGFDMHPDIDMKGYKIKNERELDSEYWNEMAQNYLSAKIKHVQQINTNKAKNVIMFLGDGMSLPTIAATRMYMGGEELNLSFDDFPYSGMAKTYCVNRQVADSGCSATAYLAGVKANYGTIGVNAKVERYDCESAFNPAHQTHSITKWAQDQGMATGLVTTTRITHATPASIYSHSSDRDWESDRDVVKAKCNPNVTHDIARQLIESDVGKNLNIIFGGGRREFINNTEKDEDGEFGVRLDGRNLIKEWIAERKANGVRAKYVWDKKSLSKVSVTFTDQILGLFANTHMPYHLETDLAKNKPSLMEMTKVAIKMMKKSKNGYFLFVEGGLIDLAHHNNWARKSLEETAEFSRAIEMAIGMVNQSDTLVVVTADHSHTMSYNGYPLRGSPVPGITGKYGSDNLPIPTLSYANGMGYYNTYNDDGIRKDLRKTDFNDIHLKIMAAVPISSETHGGEDVSVHALGPYAHLFNGNYEQNSIPVMMAYAAKIGPYAKCNRFDREFCRLD